MPEFQLDTSGFVILRGTDAPEPHNIGPAHQWPDLTPPQQGYVDAALKAFYRQEQAIAAAHLGRSPQEAYARYGFRHLAPETLAAMLKDCEAIAALAGMRVRPDRDGGRHIWVRRQEGCYAADGFPPLTLYLGDDGKVYQREAS